MPFESFEACTPCGPKCLRIQTLSYTLMKKDNLDRPYEHHRQRGAPCLVTLTLEFDTMATLMAHLNEALAINKVTSICDKEAELKVPCSHAVGATCIFLFLFLGVFILLFGRLPGRRRSAALEVNSATVASRACICCWVLKTRRHIEGSFFQMQFTRVIRTTH